MSALPFRPDIEGLRAVAIGLVIAAHAGVPGFAGGVVGVDVFFVLSGYLITRMLAHPSRPGVVAFYAARLRRLLPALLLVFVVTLLASMLLLAPMEQRAQAGIAAAVPLWLSNFALAARGIDYFAPQAETLVFQHTWSLGLEEQFYLAWPWLLMLAVGLWSRRETRARWLLPLVFAASLAWCILATTASPVSSYYLLPTRAWQFALGGAVALGFDPALRAQARLARPAWLGFAGVAGLLASALWLDESTAYPGWRALVPTVATALLLLAGTHAQAPTTRALSTPPLQFVGRLSYGWYLWHWPVLLLGATLVEPSLPNNLALAALALLLAWASHRWLERPVRHAPALIARPGWVIAGALPLMAAGAFAAMQWGAAAERWQEHPQQRRFLGATVELPAVYQRDCDDFHREFRTPCEFGARDAARTVVLLGDSIGLQWFPAVHRSLDADTRLVVLTRSSCPMIDAFARAPRDAAGCAAWREQAHAWLARERPDQVLVGWSGNYGLDPARVEPATREAMSRLAAATRDLVVLAPTPLPAFDGPACLARLAWRPAWLRTTPCSAPLQPAPNNAASRRALAGIANAHWLDLDDLACPSGECRAEVDGRIVYRDRLHLAAGFVEAQAPAFAERLRALSARDR